MKHSELISRLEVEKAKAAKEYDDAMSDLMKNHGEQTAKISELVEKMEAIEKIITPVMNGDVKQTQATARAMLEYLKLSELINDLRIASRAAYPATMGKKPGVPLG